jgi:hypothetical protein
MNAVQTQYQQRRAAANLSYVQRRHGACVPTDFAATGNNSCGTSASPYIANCSYDGAKAVLSQFYGTLNARNDAPAAANYIEFDQTPFTANPGMAPTGWLYVPANCASGAVCRLHVALHGCQQNVATIGDKFLKNTGYTRWADTNSIVVLFRRRRWTTPPAPPPAARWPTPTAAGTGWAGTAATSPSGPARRCRPSRPWWTRWPPARAPAVVAAALPRAHRRWWLRAPPTPP